MLCCLALIIACALFFNYFFIKGFSDVLAVAPVTLIKPQKSVFKAPSAELSAISGDELLDRLPFLFSGCRVQLRRDY